MDSQELRNLSEAYLEVYQEIDEAKVEAGANDTAKKDTKRRRFVGAEKEKDYDAMGSSASNWVSASRLRAHKASRGMKKEAVDLYDIILSHLLDEGYADTQEAAEAIMVNMSEEWRESIVEEVEQLDEISDKKVIAARNKLAKRTDRSVSALSRRDSFIQDTNREGRMNAKIQARNQRTGSNVEPTFIRRHQ